MATSTLSSVMNEAHRPSPAITKANAQLTSDSSKIFIVGHQDFSLDGLASMLESQDENYLVSCVEPDDECMQKFTNSKPDCLLIQNDSLPQPFERFFGEVLRHFSNIRILVFGKNMSDDYLYSLVRAGAHGYINERMDGEHFKHALDSVLNGNRWIERHILERFVADQQNFDEILESQFNDRIDHLCEHLTRRETEILCEVVKGLAIKQIAEQVHLSHQGVKMHLAKLFKKFNVSNRNQLILATFDEMSPVEDLSILLRNRLSKRLLNRHSGSQ